MRRRHFGSRVFADAQLTARTGLVGHWVAGAGSGLSWLDRSGYQNHAVFAGAPKWTLGGPNQTRAAVQFAAGTDLANAGSPALFDDLVGMTVAAWVYTTSLAGEQQIVAKIKTDYSAGWLFYIDQTTGYLGWYQVASPATNGHQILVGLPTNRWVHCAFTKTAAGSGFMLYINGTALDQNTADGNAPVSDVVANLTLGGREADTAGLVGTLDDVRLYNRALAQAEIARLADPSFQFTLPTARRHPSQGVSVVSAGRRFRRERRAGFSVSSPGGFF